MSSQTRKCLYSTDFANQQSTVDRPEMWPFTAPERPFWWLLTQNLQAGFYLSKNNSAHIQHFGGSSNSSPRSESIFLSMSSTCTSLQGHTQILERSRPSHLLLATSTTSTLGQNHCTYTTQHNSIGEVSPDFTDSWHSFSVLLGWWPNRLSAVCLVAGMAPTKNDMGWSLWQYWMEGSASVGKFMEEGDRKCQRTGQREEMGWGHRLMAVRAAQGITMWEMSSTSEESGETRHQLRFCTLSWI